MQIDNDRFRLYWIAAAVLATTLASASAEELKDPGIGDPYPLANCVVQEMPLDEHAEAITAEGREVRVCCPECSDRFFEDNFLWIETIDNLIIQQQLPHYPLTTCIVDQKALPPNLGLGLGPINYVFRNRLFRLCSGKCREELEKAPAQFFGKLDHAVIEQQKPNYPLTECVVSGTPLGKNSVDHVVANLLIRLADSAQIEHFERTPGKYLAKLRGAVRQRANASRRAEQE